MALRERVTELHGLLVVAHEEACQVGTVEDVFIDPERRALAALTIRPTNGRGLSMLPGEAIVTLGRDVVFVSSQATLTDAPAEMPGRNIKDLQGLWVTTLEGRHLGTLVDLDVSAGDWRIGELRLDGGKILPIAPEQLMIGPDEILVPAHCADMFSEVSPPKRQGLLTRLLGIRRVSETERVIRRATRKRAGADVVPPEEEETE